MHRNAEKLMANAVEKYVAPWTKYSVLDVGSRNVNGTFRTFFAGEGIRYHGIDICAGPGVDEVVDPDGWWHNIPDESFELVISGQCLEHARMPWVLAEAMHRVCKTGGLVICMAPWKHQHHPYPIDCWRLLPDGMSAMMCEWAGFEQHECFMSGSDTMFVGVKP